MTSPSGDRPDAEQREPEWVKLDQSGAWIGWTGHINLCRKCWTPLALITEDSGYNYDGRKNHVRGPPLEAPGEPTMATASLKAAAEHLRELIAHDASIEAHLALYEIEAVLRASALPLVHREEKQ